MARSHRRQVVFPEVLRTATVVGTEQLGSSMRRIILEGDQLEAFAHNGFEFPAMRSEGFDDYVRLFFPAGDGEGVVLPVQRERSVEWPRDPWPVSRVYTVRRFEPDRGRLTLDFVTHETGVATTWGRCAEPGDTIDLLGPVRSEHAPAQIDWTLLIGDMTALPAIARFLDEMSATEKARVFIDADESISLPDAPGAEVTIVSGVGALENAVRQAVWWPGSVFAWVAGEAIAIKGIRRYLRDDRALPPSMVDVSGYWRKAEPVEAAVSREPFEKLNALAELFSPFAVRAANTLGIPQNVSRGIGRVDELAVATGTDSRALAKFVRYLTAIDVLAENTHGDLVLAEVGEAMLGDDWIGRWLDMDGIEARVELSITGLVDSLRTGDASASAVTGHTLTEDLERHPRLAGLHHDHIADEAALLGPALTQDYSLSGVQNLLITGAGSAVVLGSILSEYQDLSATVLGLPTDLTFARRDLTAWPELGRRVEFSAQSPLAPPTTGGYDRYILLEVTGHYRDDDLVLLLRNAAEGLSNNGSLVVVERLSIEESMGEDQAEFDLLMLCMHGSGVRTRAEFDDIAATAGLVVTASCLVGWGIAVLDLQVR